MSTDNWRDHILTEFTPNVARLTLVADPDGLLLEEGVLAGILQRGFELIPFEEKGIRRWCICQGQQGKSHYHPVEDLAHRAPQTRDAAG